MDSNKLAIPIAVIVAGVLIAGAVYFSTGKSPTNTNPPEQNQEGEIRPVSKDDYILGSPDAKIVIVEYSDTECPFCKEFHFTMHKIIDEYGKNGDVAWVFRHFPIESLHSKSPKEAEALECAAELGGNDKFWQYLDKVFEKTPSNNGLDLSVLPDIAVEIGLNKDDFNECLESGRGKARVDSDLAEAIASGARGTPHNVIFTRDGQKVVVPGALPYESLKDIIDSSLSEIQ